ncbi:hypothetical protein PG993_001055 [Apiospora rasikravindrae]|uniref:Ankyrin repeat protein n=1 Tax=Apiospora rasikravindrae TaxID=990691 RepID=A0ABR1UAA9_9PEZI
MLRIIDIIDVVMDDDLFTHLMFEAVADNEWKSGPARDNNFAVIDALVASNDGEAPTPGDALDLLTYVFDAGNLGNAQHLVALTGLGWEELKELGPKYFLWDERLSFTKYVLDHCWRIKSVDNDDLASVLRQECAEALLAATFTSGDRCKDDKEGECEMRRQRPKERTIAYLLGYVTSDAEQVVSCAAQSGWPPYIDLVVTHCLKHGIPWDLGDESATMPLEYALMDEQWPCVFRLLHYGADPTRVETTGGQSFQQHVMPLVYRLKEQTNLITGGDWQVTTDESVAAAAEYMETIDGLASLLQERIATGRYSSPSSGDLKSIFSIQECDIEGDLCLSTQHPAHLLARDVPMAQQCALLKLLTDSGGRRLEELITHFWMTNSYPDSEDPPSSPNDTWLYEEDF